MQATQFSPEEVAQLRAHGIVLFADRVIFEAQPPMTIDQIAEVQALCSGEIPPAMVVLWQLTAGGRLDYDLWLRMNDCEEGISWTELFYNGSDGYRDLTGWIEHQQELAEDEARERGVTWNGKLNVLPIGGFEYSDRIYVVTNPIAGYDCGCVVAWKMGLDWGGAMHDDGQTVVAPDLYAAFRTPQLDTDPLEPASQYHAGEELLHYLHERQENHGMSEALADRLIAFYRGTIVDWRTPLTSGNLGRQPAKARCALRYAIDSDDAALVAQLASANVRFDEVLVGSNIPTHYALRRRKYAATTALIKVGAPVKADALASVSGPVSPELVKLLLDAGVLPTADAMAQCVAYGVPESAGHIGMALSQRGIDVAAAYSQASAALLQDCESDADKVRKGQHSHYLGLEGLEMRVQRLRDFKFAPSAEIG